MFIIGSQKRGGHKSPKSGREGLKELKFERTG